MLKIEKWKNYRIHLEGFEHWALLTSIEKDHMIYARNQNFRYTHYLNYIGLNLNQYSIDYINDCIHFDEPIAVMAPDHKSINYVKIIKIEEID